MAKKRRRKLTAEEHAELDARAERTLRMLQERIDHHKAKLAQERAAKPAD